MIKPARRIEESRHARYARVPGLPTDRPKIDITRPGPWGNPFKDGSRDSNCDRFEVWLKDQFELLNERHRLRGADLICACWLRQRCHGDTWAAVANMTRDELFEWMLTPGPSLRM